VHDLLGLTIANHQPHQIQHVNDDKSKYEIEDLTDMPLPHTPNATQDNIPLRSCRIMLSTPSHITGLEELARILSP